MTAKSYLEYRPSGAPWIGEVPTHWEIRRLKNVGIAKIGLTYSPSNLVDENNGNLVLRASNIQNGRIVYEDNVFVNSAIPSQMILRQGDILICSRSGSRDLIGKNAMIDCDAEGFAFGAFMTVFRSEYNKYVYYVFNSGLFQYHVGLFGTSTVNQITLEILLDLNIPLPPLPEQRAIARYLDYVDGRIQRYIRAKERLIELLEEQKRAVINQAVTRGLNPDVPMKPSGVEWLGDIPAHWEVRRLKFLYKEVGTRSKTGGEELMSVSHKTGVTPRKENVNMFLAESNVGYKLCEPGDVVINTMWAYMAALGVTRQIGLVSPSYGVYRPIYRGKLNDDFVDTLLRIEPYRANYLIRSTGITSSRLRLYPDSFLDIPLVYPQHDEQSAIVSYLGRATTATDAAIARARRQIDLFHEYRVRLIADVVTGKLDVRHAAAILPHVGRDEDLDESRGDVDRVEFTEVR